LISSLEIVRREKLTDFWKA